MGTKLETAETDKAFPTAAQGLLLLGETIRRGFSFSSIAASGPRPRLIVISTVERHAGGLHIEVTG